MPRPAIAALSLDLDDEWAYLKTRGDPAWATLPSYLPTVVPLILSVLAARNLHCTVFVVGKDAGEKRNRDALSAIAEAGHEIGNHSLNHDPWLHLQSESQLDEEIGGAELLIKAVTGQQPVGFRGPGFSLSHCALQVLARRGYLYDASTLPSFAGPLARAYYLATGRFDAEQRARLNRLFGGWREGTRPLRPYRWRVGESSLIELPVTTFPGPRMPIHMTYVMFLAGWSPTLARAYFSAAITACRMTGVEPSILLHALDFLGGEDAPRLAFFPSMRMDRSRKLAILDDCLEILQRAYDIVTLREHASRVAGFERLPELTLEPILE